jgi:hypothetical protein
MVVFQLQSFAKTSVRFINLRHLSLYLPLYGDGRSVGGILRLAYLLELAPVLEELELHVSGFDNFKICSQFLKHALCVDIFVVAQRHPCYFLLPTFLSFI